MTPTEHLASESADSADGVHQARTRVAPRLDVEPGGGAEKAHEDPQGVAPSNAEIPTVRGRAVSERLEHPSQLQLEIVALDVGPVPDLRSGRFHSSGVQLGCQRGEIEASPDGERYGSPDPSVDLHQHRTVRGLPELHHCEARPREWLEQLPCEPEELRVHRLAHSGSAHAAPDGYLSQASMLERGDGGPVVTEQIDSDAGHVLLDHQRSRDGLGLPHLVKLVPGASERDLAGGDRPVSARLVRHERHARPQPVDVADDGRPHAEPATPRRAKTSSDGTTSTAWRIV